MEENAECDFELPELISSSDDQSLIISICAIHFNLALTPLPPTVPLACHVLEMTILLSLNILSTQKMAK